MSIRKSWGEYHKSFLDTIIQKIRTCQIIKHINTETRVLDLGCGYYGELLSHLAPKIKSGVGIDLSVSKNLKINNITLMRGRVDRAIKLEGNSFDVVTALAVIEHTTDPIMMLKEARRLLKKRGVLLLTTPDIKSKPLLEFLAYDLSIISKSEIEDHKQYFSKNSLTKILVTAGFDLSQIKIRKFELGLNLFALAVK